VTYSAKKESFGGLESALIFDDWFNSVALVDLSIDPGSSIGKIAFMS